MLEVGSGIALAYCGYLLAGMGAEVLKVEPRGGDEMRSVGPFPGDHPHRERSARFLHLHRGKQSVAIDQQSSAGGGELLQLLGGADIVISDRSPDARLELGIDLPGLRTRRPELVLTVISWFGMTGPRAHWYGSELIAQAASGLMSCTGEPDREPLQVGGAPAQYAAGQTAAVAALCSLLGVLRHGRGSVLDVSVQEAAADLLEMWSLGPYMGRPMPRLGSRHNSLYPFEVYPCADGFVGIHTRPGPWSAMAEIFDPRLADPRFEQVAGREQYRHEVDPIIRASLATRRKLDVYHAGQSHRLAFGYVAEAADLLNSPHLRERNALPHIAHPEAGTLRYPGAPFRMHTTPWHDARAPLFDENQASTWHTPRDTRIPKGGHGAPGLPLAGVRVVDLTQIWAGPRCTKVLADWGADVIKVESHRRTDSTRAYDAFRSSPGPHDEAAERQHNRKHQFEQLHRGQRSVTIDPTTAEGHEQLLDLIRVSDVVVANFAYGVLERLKLAYADLSAVRPDIIELSMTGFGDSGPERDYVAFGVTQEELCGIYALTGYPGERPLKSGSNIGDPMNGMHGACAVLAALLHRERTGQGQYIELSQLESSLPLVGEVIIDAQINQRNGRPTGNRHQLWAPHGVYRCLGEDQWLALTCTNDEQWREFATVIGRTTLATDPRFHTAEARRRHTAALDAEILAWTATQQACNAAEIVQARGIPAAPVLTSIDIEHDAHLHLRGFHPTLRHPDGAERNYYGPIWQSDGSRPRLRGPAPLLGEHNGAIFHDLLGTQKERQP